MKARYFRTLVVYLLVSGTAGAAAPLTKQASPSFDLSLIEVMGLIGWGFTLSCLVFYLFLQTRGKKDPRSRLASESHHLRRAAGNDKRRLY